MGGKFVRNDDMFGCFANIKTDYSQRLHQYKIVGRIKSNCYCDAPVLVGCRPYVHEEIEDVLRVIHCGICEENVIRVALKDVDTIERLEPYKERE